MLPLADITVAVTVSVTKVVELAPSAMTDVTVDRAVSLLVEVYTVRIVV
jgi:hypothetical protein